MRALKSLVLLVLVLVFCAGNIATVRADEVDRLIKQLRDEDWTVRLVAAIDLGRIKDNRAVEPLIAALKDKDWLVRVVAVEALGKIKDNRAVEPLIAALKDKNWLVRKDLRKQVASALRKIIGEYVGETPEEWQKWWEQNKEKFR